MSGFKLGQKVRINTNGFTTFGVLRGDIGTIEGYDIIESKFKVSSTSLPLRNSFLKVKESELEPLNCSRPHAELIKAWADGAEIERYSIPLESWIKVDNPRFHEGREYRIKPEEPPKFDIANHEFEDLYLKYDGTGVNSDGIKCCWFATLNFSTYYLSKTDVVALAKHFELSVEDLSK